MGKEDAERKAVHRAMVQGQQQHMLLLVQAEKPRPQTVITAGGQSICRVREDGQRVIGPVQRGHDSQIFSLEYRQNLEPYETKFCENEDDQDSGQWLIKL